MAMAGNINRNVWQGREEREPKEASRARKRAKEFAFDQRRVNGKLRDRDHVGRMNSRQEGVRQ